MAKKITDTTASKATAFETSQWLPRQNRTGCGNAVCWPFHSCHGVYQSVSPWVDVA